MGKAQRAHQPRRIKMLSQCPYCQKELKLSDGQLAKIQEALGRLGPGKHLKLGCPLCHKPIYLTADGRTLDPDGKENGTPKEAPAQKEKEAPQPVNPPPEPPQPPSIEWLASGVFEDQEVIEDVPMALILMPDTPARKSIADAFEALGYRPEYADSGTDGIDRMRFVNFGAVVLHEQLEGKPLAENGFHSYMQWLPMVKRRYIFYVLVGPSFRSLYDLEALANSANVVINDADCEHAEIVLKKSFADYEALFLPLITMLKAHGKK